LTKFLVALIFVVLVGAVLVRFRALVVPLLFAFILAYMLNPLMEWLTARTRLSWSMAVNVMYLVIAVLLIAVLTAAGIALVQQIEGLYRVLVEILPRLPTRLENLLSQPIDLGPFVLDLTQPINVGPLVLDLTTLDLRPLYDQLLATLQPALSRTGNLVGSLASGTAEFLAWILFILVVSYYLLHDLKTLSPSLERIVPEGYAPDVRRLTAELGPIWHAFLRGQITLAIVMGLVVGTAMGLLGVRYAPGLGLLAGLLEFLPIIGPFIAGAVAVIVALFQPSNPLGLPPFYFALVVLGVFLLLQQLENNFLVPRILGSSLKLHPVVILVGAIIGASLAGIVGLLLSAPTMATLKLFGRYVFRKMLDLDPWPEPPPRPEPPPKLEWPRWLRLSRQKPAGGGEAGEVQSAQSEGQTPSGN
jgi:predicted PurR-regulated permease PerM